MAKLPSFQFYPGDWLRNDVSGCSLEAQGLWLRMMLIMHDAEVYGELSINGKPLPDNFIAKKCGISEQKYRKVLKELDDFFVINRKKNGVIYSGRMQRDEDKRMQTKGRVEKHRAVSNASVTQMKRDSSSSSSISNIREEENSTAYTLYREFFPKFQLAIHQTEMLQTAEVDEAEFRECLKFWAGHGYAERNVIGLLDCYNSKNYKPKPTKPEPKPEPKVMSGRERAAELDWIQKNTKITIPTPRNGTKKNDNNQ